MAFAVPGKDCAILWARIVNPALTTGHATATADSPWQFRRRWGTQGALREEPSMRIWPGRRRKSFEKSPEGKLAGLLARHAVTCVIDVGANTGQTGTMLRRIGFTGRIVSFEPGPPAHADLARAAASDPAWTVPPPMAVGRAPGEIVLHIAEASDMSSALAPTGALLQALPKSRAGASVTVPVTTVAAIMADHGLAGETVLLKIDTQGMELDVLAGAEPVLADIAGIHAELSLIPLYQGEPDYLEVLQWLHARGFRPAMLTERTFSRTLGRQLQVDGLFFRADAAAD
jgi:FkbM family methyltransferase